MKAVINAGSLAAAAAEAKTIAGKTQHSIPILDCALLEAGPDGFHMESTSLYDRIRRRIEGAGDSYKPSKACVRADDLAAFTAGLTGQVTISHDPKEMELTIEHARGELRMPSSDPDDFPPLRDGTKTRQRESIPAVELAAALRRVWPAVSHDETRAHLAGVFFNSVGKDGLRIEGTDSHRCAMMDVDATWNEATLVPYHAIPSLLRIIGDHDGDVGVEISAGYTRFDLPGVQLWTKGCNDPFPPLDRVMPEDDGKVVTVKREPLLEAVKRLQKVAKTKYEKSTSSKLVLEFEKGKLTVRGESNQRGRGHEVIETDGSWKGELGMDAAYLGEHLATGEGDDVELRFHGSIQPFELRFPEAESLRVVIMPSRLS